MKCQRPAVATRGIPERPISESDRKMIKQYVANSQKALWPSLLTDMFGISTSAAKQFLSKTK